MRAKEAGAVGLIATTDWSFSHGRDWGSPKISEQMNLRRCFGSVGVEPWGQQLDGTPAAIRCLPAVAAAVGDQVEVLLDGGIRRGSDVIKALALGARAVMIGRAYLWGLAANGQAGVENVLDVLRGGIDSALMGMGHSSIRDLSPDDILVPEGFTRALGAAGLGH